MEFPLDIPVIDCANLARREAEVVSAVDRALHEVGFMAVTGLPVSAATRERLDAVAAAFFARSAEEKRRFAYGSAAENFGFQGLGQEALDPQQPADLKESFTLRNLLGAQVPAARWPDEAFRAAVQDFYREAMAAAGLLQEILALALDMPRDFFHPLHRGENVTLRLLHYPPVPPDAPEEAQLGAGAHTDYGMLTLLWQDAVGGLQVRDESGNWHDVPPRRDAVVINAGDMLERWSNGRYRSTWHRVLPRTAGSERFSVALFVDPDSATLIEALPSCVEAGEQPRFPAITAGEHLTARIEATHRNGPGARQ